jgi:Flp pilus assembly protein TadD
MRARGLRLTLAGLAVLACAWFTLGAVQAIGVNRATAVLAGGPPSPRQAAAARSWLATASTLNPDQTVNILRGELAYAQGDVPRAVSILTAVTRAEPQNLDAWLALAHRAGRYPQLFVVALHHIGQLLPPVRRR